MGPGLGQRQHTGGAGGTGTRCVERTSELRPCWCFLPCYSYQDHKSPGYHHHTYVCVLGGAFPHPQFQCLNKASTQRSPRMPTGRSMLTTEGLPPRPPPPHLPL